MKSLIAISFCLACGLGAHASPSDYAPFALGSAPMPFPVAECRRVPAEAPSTSAVSECRFIPATAPWLIDDNPGRGAKREFSPAETVRYRERSGVERVNSHLHEEHGGRHVRVRGPAKVAAHLAFGLVVIAAEQMLKMLV